MRELRQVNRLWMRIPETDVVLRRVFLTRKNSRHVKSFTACFSTQVLVTRKI